MKKTISLLIITLLTLSMSACTNKKVKEPVANMVNPVSELSSLEELNKECGTMIAKPAVMGISDERFSKINAGDYAIAQYDFTVAGRECFIRNAAVREDISGFYINGSSAFNEAKNEIEYVEADDTFLARFFNIEGQFVFGMKKDNETDMDYFMMVAEEIAMTNNFANAEAAYFDVQEYCGYYYDTYSMRASMNISANDEEALMVDITWGSSATETSEWIASMRYENGMLVYDDMTKINWLGDEETVEYENGNGYFEIKEDGSLLWTGALEENCQNCEFVKAEN